MPSSSKSAPVKTSESAKKQNATASKESKSTPKKIEEVTIKSSSEPLKKDISKKEDSKLVVNLTLIKVTPAEIKAALDKMIESEKKSTVSKFKSFFGLNSAKKENLVDAKTPLERLTKFSNSFAQADQKQFLNPNDTWELITLALHPQIQPNSTDDNVYHDIIGIKLDILTKRNRILTKLRWWNDFYDIEKEKFSLYCHRTDKTASHEEVAEIAAMKLRPKPLSFTDQVKQEARSLASDIEGVFQSASSDISKLFS